VLFDNFSAKNSVLFLEKDCIFDVFCDLVGGDGEGVGWEEFGEGFVAGAGISGVSG
jgi:hypothetical protein